MDIFNYVFIWCFSNGLLCLNKIPNLSNKCVLHDGDLLLAVDVRIAGHVRLLLDGDVALGAGERAHQVLVGGALAEGAAQLLHEPRARGAAERVVAVERGLQWWKANIRARLRKTKCPAAVGRV